MSHIFLAEDIDKNYLDVKCRAATKISNGRGIGVKVLFYYESSQRFFLLMLGKIHNFPFPDLSFMRALTKTASLQITFLYKPVTRFNLTCSQFGQTIKRRENNVSFQ